MNNSIVSNASEVSASGINASDITRILFENFHPNAVHLFYVIGYIAIAVFL